MLDHKARRRLLYSAVTVLEPFACAPLVQHYVAWRHDLTLPLLRIYVDLERATRGGHLVRHIRPRLGGEGMMFFWETPGLALVEAEQPPQGRLTAAAPLANSIPLEAMLVGSGFDVPRLKAWQASWDRAGASVQDGI
jgi:hypothetical protein